MNKQELLSGIVFHLNEYAEMLSNVFNGGNSKWAKKQVKEIDKILDTLCDYKLVEKERLEV